MADKYKMTPEDLQALRDQAVEIGLRDAELAKFLQLLIPHVAHAHGLDPLEEDERQREELADRKEDARKKQEKIVGKVELTPAQEESKRIAKAQGKPYAPGHAEQLDPVAHETQQHGAGTVPTAQAEEAVLYEGPSNVQDPANSSLADLSSGETAPVKHEGRDQRDHGKGRH